ncbi:MAG: aminoacyl-tRNA hydrolase [Bacteroidota bacterium]
MKYLIVGLGNIGSDYKGTRHNIGFMVVDQLLEKLGGEFVLDRHAHTALAKHKGRQLHLIKPTTYMNLSGKAVKFHLSKHKIPLENLLIITDDLSLPFGKLRLRAKGSAGGHNGHKHIQEVMATQAYARLKFGIGDDFSRGKQVNYVLDPFTIHEQAELPNHIDRAVDMTLAFATVGINRAMGMFNGK